MLRDLKSPKKGKKRKEKKNIYFFWNFSSKVSWSQIYLVLSKVTQPENAGVKAQKSLWRSAYQKVQILAWHQKRREKRERISSLGKIKLWHSIKGPQVLEPHPPGCYLNKAPDPKSSSFRDLIGFIQEDMKKRKQKKQGTDFCGIADLLKRKSISQKRPERQKALHGKNAAWSSLDYFWNTLNSLKSTERDGYGCWVWN